MTQPRATFAKIDLSAFCHNFKTIRTALNPGVGILAVVKANAYGHGAIACSRAALECGAVGLGVGILDEGVALREQDITAPILLLDSIFSNEIDDIIHYNLSPVVSQPSLIADLQTKAKQKNRIVGVHLKIDTGMGRLGISPQGFPDLYDQVKRSDFLRLEGISTHFACADDEDPASALEQLSRFKKALESIPGFKGPPPKIHCANSSAMIRFPESHFDWVRPGLALYGALPSHNLEPFWGQWVANGAQLKPVMHWKTRIIQINDLPVGAGVSYGSTFQTQKESRIATLPVGYADGLSRKLSNKMQMLLNGQRVQQVGTICMDMCLIDVTGFPQARVGDEVVIIGSQKDVSISVEEVAQWSGTIPYEILCAVSERVPRVFCD